MKREALILVLIALTVRHLVPRWSQATERRLPGFFKDYKTLMFNGYGDQVASLYSGMDLRKNF